MILFKGVKAVVRVTTISFICWTILTTTLPLLNIKFQSQTALNAVPDVLQNTNIQILIAHPDDEVMFFGPSILQLLKKQYNNHISLTCFSTGNNQGLGSIRSEELVRSLQILGITDYEIVNDETKFRDAMDISWDEQDILPYIKAEAQVILTFDGDGISNHPNHKSLYMASLRTNKKVFALKSWDMHEKYSFSLLTCLQLVKNYYIPSIWGTEPTKSANIFIYSDLADYLTTLTAMVAGHKSQMVWFRYGWVVLSKYLNSNELVQVK